MGVVESQIASLAIVYSTVYSGVDWRKHQSSASLAFVWGIHWWPVNSPHKWPVTQKRFPFDDVIMTKPCAYSMGPAAYYRIWQSFLLIILSLFRKTQNFRLLPSEKHWICYMTSLFFKLNQWCMPMHRNKSNITYLLTVMYDIVARMHPVREKNICTLSDGFYYPISCTGFIIWRPNYVTGLSIPGLWLGVSLQGKMHLLLFQSHHFMQYVP